MDDELISRGAIAALLFEVSGIAASHERSEQVLPGGVEDGEDEAE